jgi:transcriptional regulator with XRE-family HTH domain
LPVENFTDFILERLISVRESLNINKAKAECMLNMSAMGYGRYEKGELEPSYQTVNYIAQMFHTLIDYLYEYSDEMNVRTTIISEKDEPDLFLLIELTRQDEKIIASLTRICKIPVSLKYIKISLF